MSRQFDIHPNRFRRGRFDPPFLINLQADLLADRSTVVVAPLWPATDEDRTLARLHPMLEIDGDFYRVGIEDMASIRRSALAGAVDNAEAERDRLIAAIDILFTGV